MTSWDKSNNSQATNLVLSKDAGTTPRDPRRPPSSSQRNPQRAYVEVAVTVEPEGGGFRISRSSLTLRAQVPNLDQTAFAQMVGDAERNCPVSKVLNAAITVDAKLHLRT